MTSILIARTAVAWPAEPERTILTGAAAEATSFALSPDRTRVASTSGEQVRVWDADTGNAVFTVEGPGAASAAFSPDGKRLAVAWDRTHPAIYNAEDGSRMFEVSARDSRVGGYPFPPMIVAVTFSHDGRWLATASSAAPVGGQHGLPGGTTKIFDLESRELLHACTGLPSVATALAFSPDGKILAVGTFGAPGELPEPGQVSLWDTGSGERLHTLSGKAKVIPGENHGAITALAFSPDSKRLAWGDTEGTVRVCDLPNDTPAFTLTGHGWVGALAFSPRGDRLASGGDKGVVCLWDTANGKRVRTLEGKTFPVRALVFSADGQRLTCACGATSRYAPGIAGLIDDDAPESPTPPGNAGEVLHWDVAPVP